MKVKKVNLREDLYMENTDGHALLASRCKTCRQIYFPKKTICYSCIDSNLEEIALSRFGILYSYTIGRMPSMHFEPPYVIGFIKMPEGIRIFSPIKMIEGKSLKVDMKMELVIEKLWEEEDKEIIGYKFAPV